MHADSSGAAEEELEAGGLRLSPAPPKTIHRNGGPLVTRPSRVTTAKRAHARRLQVRSSRRRATHTARQLGDDGDFELDIRDAPPRPPRPPSPSSWAGPRRDPTVGRIAIIYRVGHRGGSAGRRRWPRGTRRSAITDDDDERCAAGLVATTTAALVAPTSPPAHRAPARRLAAPALAAAAGTMPLGGRATMSTRTRWRWASRCRRCSPSSCRRRARWQSRAPVARPRRRVQRAAAARRMLPRAQVGGGRRATRLRSAAAQRLNLAVALTSILAVAVPPRPLLACIVGRVGSALLCLEVWSQSSGVPQSDPCCRWWARSARSPRARRARRPCVGLLLPWGGAAATPARAPARRAATRSPPSRSAASPRGRSRRPPPPPPRTGRPPGRARAARGTSTAGLAAACAATLADAASRGHLGVDLPVAQPRTAGGDRRFLASQAACWLVLSGLKDTVGAAARGSRRRALLALVAAGLQLARRTARGCGKRVA